MPLETTDDDILSHLAYADENSTADIRMGDVIRARHHESATTAHSPAKTATAFLARCRVLIARANAAMER